MMARSLHCVLTKVRDLPTYDDLNEVYTFLDGFERDVLEKQHFQALDWVLRYAREMVVYAQRKFLQLVRM